MSSSAVAAATLTCSADKPQFWHKKPRRSRGTKFRTIGFRHKANKKSKNTARANFGFGIRVLSYRKGRLSPVPLASGKIVGRSNIVL